MPSTQSNPAKLESPPASSRRRRTRRKPATDDWYDPEFLRRKHLLALGLVLILVGASGLYLIWSGSDFQSMIRSWVHPQ